MTTITNIVGLTGAAYVGATAASINDEGQIVGYGETIASGSQAGSVVGVEWQDGSASALTGLSGENAVYAYAINANGVVVGVGSSGTGDNHALMWQNGKVADLGTLGGLSSDSSYAFSLNDLGQAVGASSDASGHYYAALWQNGTVTNLGTLLAAGVTPATYIDTYSEAEDINNAGQIVGDALATSNAMHAFIWQGGTMSDLGVLAGGSASFAHAINNNGLVVGDAVTSQGQTHAVQWQAGKITDLGTLAGYAESSAEGVSDSGIIVGKAFNIDPNTGYTTTEHAVIARADPIRHLRPIESAT